MVMDLIGDDYKGMAVKYSREYEQLGTGGGVALAQKLIDQDALLVMNGDSAIHTSLTEFISHAVEAQTAALLAVEVADTTRYGSLDIVDGVVQAFMEKGRSGEGWINAGVYYLPRTALALLPEEGASSLETDLLRLLTGSLRAKCCKAAFLDIGTPEDFCLAADAEWFDELGKC